MKINFRPIELFYGLGCVPIRIVTHYQKLMYTCFRLLYTGSRSLNGVQNRAITRYALFVVWKLYTCRFATQQTEHFSFRNSSIYNQRLISEKCLFLREQKQTACTHFSSLAPMYIRSKERPLYTRLSSLREAETCRVCR